MQLDVGARGEVEFGVSDSDTAEAMSSGSLAVLGTPRLVAWCEAATCRAVEGRVPVGSSTVGTSVSLQHLAASTVGARVTVTAVLLEVDGRRLVFEVEARDGSGALVGKGHVERVVVDVQRFLARADRG